MDVQKAVDSILTMPEMHAERSGRDDVVEMHAERSGRDGVVEMHAERSGRDGVASEATASDAARRDQGGGEHGDGGGGEHVGGEGGRRHEHAHAAPMSEYDKYMASRREKEKELCRP